MATDNDLAALLPDPPPPRPARREAAIAEAMRRFDGEEPSRSETARPKSAPTWWRQPPLAALASIALVVTISLPVWWLQRDRISEVVPQRPTATAAAPGAAPPAGERNSSLPTPQAAPAAPESSLSAPAGPVSVSSPTTGVDEARLEDAPTPAQERASAVGYAAQRQLAPAPAVKVVGYLRPNHGGHFLNGLFHRRFPKSTIQQVRAPADKTPLELLVLEHAP